MSIYESGNALKFTEEDIYQGGCQPITGGSWEVDISFKDNTIKGLIEKIIDYYGVEISDVELDACEEQGRIDISILENAESIQASKSEIEAWKQGKIKLWSSIYTYQVHEVTKIPIKLEVI